MNRLDFNNLRIFELNAMTFPKTSKKIDKVKFRIGMRFLEKDMQLVIDRLKCMGCGICATVCPQDAIVSGPKIKGKDDRAHSIMNDNIILDVSDPTKCVYCGTCTVFCPFDAIKLRVNNEVVPIENLDIVKKHAVPTLTGKTMMMRNAKRESHVYMKGSVEIEKIDNSNKRNFQLEYVNNCPGECHKCVDICPNEALEIMPYEEALKSGITIKTDKTLCIACGSCVMACPSSKIKLHREEIETSGPYNDIFMKRIAEKLGVPLPPK